MSVHPETMFVLPPDGALSGQQSDDMSMLNYSASAIAGFHDPAQLSQLHTHPLLPTTLQPLQVSVGYRTVSIDPKPAQTNSINGNEALLDKAPGGGAIGDRNHVQDREGLENQGGEESLFSLLRKWHFNFNSNGKCIINKNNILQPESANSVAKDFTNASRNAVDATICDHAVQGKNELYNTSSSQTVNLKTNENGIQHYSDDIHSPPNNKDPAFVPVDMEEKMATYNTPEAWDSLYKENMWKWKYKRKRDGQLWKERTEKYRKRMELMLATIGKDKEQHIVDT